ncbi:unnamed protein product, partial [Ixodes pacificus]
MAARRHTTKASCWKDVFNREPPRILKPTANISLRNLPSTV